MPSNNHKAIANQILTDLSRVNPYTKRDDQQAYMYAVGFMAGYLASLSEEDPWVYKRFRQHIESQRLPKFRHR